MIRHRKNPNVLWILSVIIITFLINVCKAGGGPGLSTGLAEINPEFISKEKKSSLKTNPKNELNDSGSSSDSESESDKEEADDEESDEEESDGEESDEEESDEEESDEEESDGEESDEEESDDESEKGRINKVLAKSNSKMLTFVKKYRAEITVAMVIFAFRNEIWSVISMLITENDPHKNGGRRMKRPSPTSIMKIILFLDVMRKLQSESAFPESGKSSALKNFVHDILSSSKTKNPAFLPPIEQHYTFEKINERYTKDRMAFSKAVNSRHPTSANTPKGRALFQKGASSKNNIPSYNSTSIILELKNLDTGVSDIDTLRDKVTYIISQHRANRDAVGDDTLIDEEGDMEHKNQTSDNETVSKMEVIIMLESPGGSASDYGLAAEQIGRLRRERGINVTICVDKVAASGGYMIAAMSSPGRLFAAPFSIVGSIGVIGQAVNIHNALQNWGVRPLVFRGGKDKAPVGLVGEVTKDGIAKVQEMVDKTHRAFKRHVVTARPILADNIDKIATGDVWLGYDALEVGLVDRIVSSDEYVGERIQEGALVLKLLKHQKPRFFWGAGMPRSGGFPGATAKLQSIFDTADEMKILLRKIIKIIDGKTEGCHDYNNIMASTI